MVSIFLFFFLSGFSALVFEVAWLRELGLIMGNTAQATGIILAVFLGGLALGAYLSGRKIDRHGFRPVAVYGLLEIGVGVLALLVSWALHSTNTVYIWLHHRVALGEFGIFMVRMLISVTLIVLPTLLMGATLPVLVRFLEQRGVSSKMFSLLYGLNTLGAAVGSLAACFVGFTYFGIQNTLLTATAINLLIGLLAVVIGRRPQENSSSPGDFAMGGIGNSPHRAKPERAEVWPMPPPVSLRLLFALSFLIGFTALSYEVLWTRILRCYMTSMTYSFTIMVSLFLLGLAVGSLLYEFRVSRMAPEKDRPLRFFCLAQFFAALLCAVGLLLFPSMSALLLRFDFESLLTKYFFFAILVSIPTIFLPSIFIGLLFPIMGSLAARHEHGAASAVASVYAANTVGCVCGSLMAGFIMVPALGSALAFKFTVGLSVLTLIIAAMIGKEMSAGGRKIISVVAILLFLLFWAAPFQPTSLLPGNRILTSREDSVTGLMRLIDYPEVDAVTLEFNGAAMASNALPNLRYMRTLAFLPILLSPHPEKVLVGCFGTGTTTGAAAICPGVKHVDSVELSKMVYDAAPFFEKTHYDVLNNPIVSAHVNDVRNFLLTTRDNYDVVTFEPPPPQFAGTVNLYTREFYQLVREHLNEDGLVCQWVPLNQVSEKVWKMLMASARSVFPHVSVWVSNNKEAVFLASTHEPKIDFTKIQQRMESSFRLMESMKGIGYDSASALLSIFLLSGDALDQAIENSPPVTDDRPMSEFFLPFAGDGIDEMALEAKGRAQRLKLSELAPDRNQFWINYQAVHILRAVFGSPQLTRAQADYLIDKAIEMRPENNWFRFVRLHRDAAYARRATAITR